MAKAKRNILILLGILFIVFGLIFLFIKYQFPEMQWFVSFEWNIFIGGLSISSALFACGDALKFSGRKRAWMLPTIGIPIAIALTIVIWKPFSMKEVEGTNADLGIYCTIISLGFMFIIRAYENKALLKRETEIKKLTEELKKLHEQFEISNDHQRKVITGMIKIRENLNGLSKKKTSKS